MKKAAYIGIYSEGTTSRMRADILQHIMPDYEWEIIDTDRPKKRSNRIFQSIGFRYKFGPVVWRINRLIKKSIKDSYDLIWVDKAIYIYPATTEYMQNHTKILLHYTPDPAFMPLYYSRHFSNSIRYYDYVVTTKSFELDIYRKLVRDDKILYITQGYDKKLHKPLNNFDKKEGICFIGRYEVERERIITKLLNAGIKVKLAGPNWKSFAEKFSDNANLTFMGEGIFGKEYVKAISSSLFAWGGISKWFPEKHTTRTFEIPACGTALITERNDETASFYNDDEAIFYSSTDDMVARIQYLMEHIEELKSITEKGHQRVIKDGRDYESIIKSILTRIF